jgi:hypothetical protein
VLIDAVHRLNKECLFCFQRGVAKTGRLLQDNLKQQKLRLLQEQKACNNFKQTTKINKK